MHKKSDLIKLAGDTLSWAVDEECIKDEDNEHDYFTTEQWCDNFGLSPKTFRRVKSQMVELGIKIALQPSRGHYISDIPADVATTPILMLKNIKARVENFAAIWDSSQKSNHAEIILDEIEQMIKDLKIEIAGEKITIDSKVRFLRG